MSILIVMIGFALLCIFVRMSSTQPVLDNDDEYQTQGNHPYLNNYIAASARYASNNLHRLDIPANLYDRDQQQQFYHNKQYNPDNVQLAKRIIMLPRVGRRSIRSASQK